MNKSTSRCAKIWKPLLLFCFVDNENRVQQISRPKDEIKSFLHKIHCRRVFSIKDWTRNGPYLFLNEKKMANDAQKSRHLGQSCFIPSSPFSPLFFKLFHILVTFSVLARTFSHKLFHLIFFCCRDICTST